jgi:ribonuclease HI
LDSSKKTPVANSELWEELIELVENRGHNVSLVKVAGHADLKGGHVPSKHERFNQLCDQLADAAIPA